MSEEFLKDVRIKNQGRRFKFRVAGIIEHNNKVLVVKMNQNPFFCFPGGHVELLEETAKAVERELNEELFFKVKVEKLLYIHENFFNAESNKFHELCFYFKAVPAEENFVPQDKNHEEMDCGQLVKHQYRWFDKKELKEIDAEPKLIIKEYLNDSDKFLHLVTNDLDKVAKS